MAPWPEQGNELKTIDKINEIRSSSFDETHSNKIENFADKGKAEDSQDPQVKGLEEGQLKALLDEAYNYKNPKDREGKSELFKELLQEVEADEKEDLNLKNQINSATNNARFNRNRRQQSRQISERQRSGGSLQNLVCAYSAELEVASNKRRSKTLKGSNSNVSARQREGGSLPSNVNHVQRVSGTSSNIFDEYKRNKDMPGHGSTREEKVSSESGLYTDCSSLTNCHSRKTSSTWGDEEGIELEDMRGTSRTYTSRATLELSHSGSDSADISGSSGVEVDSSVAFPLKPNKHNSGEMNSVQCNSLKCMMDPELGSSNKMGVTGKGESSANVVSILSIPPQPIRLDSSDDIQPDLIVNANPGTVSMLISSRDYHPMTTLPSHVIHLSDLFSEPLSNYSTSHLSTVDKCKSSYDENGNSLNHLEKKLKQRRAKAKNEKNTYLAETVDGFLGDKDINELVMFIENDGGSKKKNKIAQKQRKTCKDDSEQTKKRRGKEKLTKCNSLEEISKTKMEDLTSSVSSSQLHVCNNRVRPKKQVTLDDEQLRWHTDDNSISADEASLLGRKRKDSRTTIRDRDKDKDKERKTTMMDDEEAEFRLVQTKKHRRRKRRSVSSHHTHEQIGHHPTNVYRSPDRRHHRTSSMPPSDRSDCSDLDSVHSLPVTTTTSTRPRDRQCADEYKSASSSPGSSGGGGGSSTTPRSKSTKTTTNSSSCYSSCNSVHEPPPIMSTSNVLVGGVESKRQPNPSNYVHEPPPTMNSNHMFVEGGGCGIGVESKRHHNPSLDQDSSTVIETNNIDSINNSTESTAAHDQQQIDAIVKKRTNNNNHLYNSNELISSSCTPQPSSRDAFVNISNSTRVGGDGKLSSVANVNNCNNNDIVVLGGDLCNGVMIEQVETVTLALNTSNRCKSAVGVVAATPDAVKSSSTECDMFIEYNLPAPPPHHRHTASSSSCSSNNVEFSIPVPNSNNVTVEKTVIIKSFNSCGVSESVSLVIPPAPVPPSSSSTTSSVSSRRSRSSATSTHQPPVILMDGQQMVHSAASDLTFGFEINKQLLLKESPTAVAVTTDSFHNSSNIPVVSASILSSSHDESLLEEKFNYVDIVKFVGNAWKEVLKECSNPKSSYTMSYYSEGATSSQPGSS